MEHTIYLVSAIAGCAMIGLQVVLQVFGLFGDLDVDADADTDFDGDAADGHGDAFFGFLSFKALCAFAGIFGLVGLILLEKDVSLQSRVAVSFAAGVAGMVMVGWMMRMLARLQSSGNVDLRNATGRTCTVYLRIPGANSGRGKVTVELQGRSMELDAYTEGDEIQTGTRVTVVSVEGDDALKVVPL